MPVRPPSPPRPPCSCNSGDSKQDYLVGPAGALALAPQSMGGAQQGPLAALPSMMIWLACKHARAPAPSPTCSGCEGEEQGSVAMPQPSAGFNGVITCKDLASGCSCSQQAASLWGRCGTWANGGGRLAAAPQAVPALLHKSSANASWCSPCSTKLGASVRSPGQLMVQQAGAAGGATGRALQPTPPL